MASSTIFKARYSGRCALGDVIEPGDHVCYVDERLQHFSCSDGAEPELDLTVAERARVASRFPAGACACDC